MTSGSTSSLLRETRTRRPARPPLPLRNQPNPKAWRRCSSNVRRVWREVRDELELEGFVSHTLRKTVASFLDDADVSARKISDQLGHSKISMTQDHYLGRRLTDRQTAEVREGLFGVPGDEKSPKSVPGS